MKAMLIDINRCSGCYNCQLACKDEHCGNDWSPISKPQPETGQFWCRIQEEERGKVPVVRVSYTPHFFDNDDELLRTAPECAYRRDDGIVLFDNEAVKGRKDLADRFDGVYWNETLNLPQKCTMCAHLLDSGWTVPRCVDVCATGALRFGDEEEFGSELKDAVQFAEGSRFYYLNLPKRWIAGTLVDKEANEVVIGADVVVKDDNGNIVSTLQTDDFGDFFSESFDKAIYTVAIDVPGFAPLELIADCTQKDVVLGDIFLNPIKENCND